MLGPLQLGSVVASVARTIRTLLYSGSIMVVLNPVTLPQLGKLCPGEHTFGPACGGTLGNDVRTRSVRAHEYDGGPHALPELVTMLPREFEPPFQPTCPQARAAVRKKNQVDFMMF